MRLINMVFEELDILKQKIESLPSEKTIIINQSTSKQTSSITTSRSKHNFDEVDIYRNKTSVNS